MDRPLIRLQGVGKSFVGRAVLQNISLSINRGEITTVIGPNGAGKSSLVRIILGLLKADSGSVERAEDLRIGYMPQQLHVDPTLPLNVLRFLQLANASIEACKRALDLAGISHVWNTSFHRLSGGEKQRVLLARAVLRNPNLLVLDEPVQGVDINGQNELYSMIAKLSSQLNCGVLMVSHDLHLVMSSTDHVICLNHHICCQGKPEQVTQDPAYIDIFGETALYSHRHNHRHNIQGQVLDNEGKHRHGEGCNHD
jgi:zinc transport system ATP-binding protein